MRVISTVRSQCDHLHDLMKNDEPVLTATRDGINWTHPFAKALKLAVESKLEPLIEAERKHAVHDEQTHLDKQLRQKIDHALHELNSIAFTELSDKRDDGLQKQIDLPPSGIGFFPERAYVQTGQIVTLNLLCGVDGKSAGGSDCYCAFEQP